MLQNEVHYGKRAVCVIIHYLFIRVNCACANSRERSRVRFVYRVDTASAHYWSNVELSKVLGPTRHILGHFGEDDCGISKDYSRSAAPQCVLHRESKNSFITLTNIGRFSQCFSPSYSPWNLQQNPYLGQMDLIFHLPQLGHTHKHNHKLAEVKCFCSRHSGAGT